MRDFTKKYFHLNSSAVYNSSANETKLKVEPIETLTPAPYEKSPVAYNFISATYQMLTQPFPTLNCLE